KIFFIIGFLLLTGFYLQYSVRHWLEERHMEQLSPEERVEYQFENADRLANLRANALNFGLDLQGGMYVTLELSTNELIAELAREQRDDTFNEVLQTANEQNVETGADVIEAFVNEFENRDAGARLSRYFHRNSDELTRASTNDEVQLYLEQQRADAVDRAVEIVRNRVDRFGVTEPAIVKQGESRIVVELPGVEEDQERVRDLLRGTARLEFRTMANPEEVRNTFERVMGAVSEQETVETENEDGEIEEETVTRNPLSELIIDIGGPDVRFAYASARDTAEVNEILRREAAQRAIPSNMELMWGARAENIGTGSETYPLLAVRSNIELTGDVITDASPSFDPQTNAPEVSMEMNREGARTWSMITAANIERPVAIILDGVVYSYQTVRTQISDGRSAISGLDGIEEAEDLVNILLSGALPAPLDIIEERTVGATLGEDSIQAGFNSAIAGLVLVAIFMIFYYRTGGGIADIALVLNIIFILGILSAFKATLTLPGIAGIVLTIGMAVDANVLIFDRIREEQRVGKSLLAAIDSGYSNAMSAILDANITTFLTAVILFSFGMGPIKGFAVTLMAGIVASLFSAIVITRVIVDWLSYTRKNEVSFG
ncbi:MAG: protein translocase subunit SecD, partial [Cyclonatronaceae bacterium]